MHVLSPTSAPRLRGRAAEVGGPLVMAVLDRVPDAWTSVERRRTASRAMDAVQEAVAAGADLVQLTEPHPIPAQGAAEAVRRVVPFVEWIRSAHPGLLIGVDTGHPQVARAALIAGADLISATASGPVSGPVSGPDRQRHDRALAEVVAEFAAALVCPHAHGSIEGRLAYGSIEGRLAYGSTTDGVVDDVLAVLGAAAGQAVAAGVHPASVILDPAPDVAKNTWHALSVIRRIDAVVALGHPVLMDLSRTEFVGETLGLGRDERLEGSLAAAAVAAWSGATVFRTRDVRATRRTLDLVASLRGDRPPTVTVRGLA